MRWNRALVAASVPVVVFGCGMVVDDQRIATPEERAVVDPPPSDRDFRQQNADHKVLLAVLDTGVDYNHPVLIRNMHFTLDFTCRPVRLGRDYIGEDPWPAPYVARTSVHNRALREEDRARAGREQARAAALVRRFPDLRGFYNPLRDAVAEEFSSAYHGTHAAGLMVYDRPDLGLLAYRIAPFNWPKDPDELERAFFRNLTAAIEDAVADGARVMNMSFGVTAHVGSPQYPMVEEQQRAFRRIVARHPDVLFVAAAGNSGRVVGEGDFISYPCGVRAQNVFCVGALTERGEPTDFTNLPARGIDAVFAFGEDVFSTFPTDFCGDVPFDWLISDDASADDLMSLVRAARSRCTGRRFRLARSSGTSMAAPIVARLAGTILAEQPELSAAGVIKEIRRRAAPDKIDNQPVLKLAFERPSWYPPAVSDPDPAARPAPGPGDDSPRRWTAYLPQPHPDAE